MRTRCVSEENKETGSARRGGGGRGEGEKKRHITLSGRSEGRLVSSEPEMLLSHYHKEEEPAPRS